MEIVHLLTIDGVELVVSGLGTFLLIYGALELVGRSTEDQ